ncbi:nucleotidyl transferase AbiEii/AbiGii toxin family protein [Actinoplanes couchii]|uniref:Ankyrin n=1 Tax=Actinoplanes couchii TaxID=403638 RepID=A0ABQ3XFG0_9ACTN|nr:nucleotidyl transferase AbiEii/AbiGii toxin family protein [Actinoplanes couchii]MDR6321809.1 hypothetical protein [Actinoplanes couchii]GID57235.1 hypothetical protein Aco03nite_056390 [Actinoplanes couchii]
MTIIQHHLTVAGYDIRHLATMAESHGGFVRSVEADHYQWGPRRTIVVRGELGEWGVRVQRVQSLDDDLTGGRDFLHQVELLSEPDQVADMVRLDEIAESHGAGLFRDPRRLIIQGLRRTTVAEAGERLDRLVADLRAAGLRVGPVDRWCVRRDTDPASDVGWLTPTERFGRESVINRRRASGMPPTFQPVRKQKATQRYVFDPALKQHSNAYRPGEPVFPDPSTGRDWRAARDRAMNELLTAIGRSRFAGHLVVRGSAVMRAWLGDQARPPGDLDFVVTPVDITSDSVQARELLDAIIEASGRPAADVSESAIWTYERADGRRLVITYPDDFSLQVDVVFGEGLPIDPEPVGLRGVDVPVLAATPELSLVWKLVWLFTDRYPQGKDLYDAVLLAERFTADLDLVRELSEPDMGAEAAGFTAATVLTWSDVDWGNFLGDFPGVPGAARQWLRRLSLALSVPVTRPAPPPSPPSGGNPPDGS